MKPNTLLELQALGQSIWIDFIRRAELAAGLHGLETFLRKLRREQENNK